MIAADERVPDDLPEPVLRRALLEDDRPAHTRSILFVPNSPSGLTRSTTTITPRATARLSSDPTKLKNDGMKASADADDQPPTTAPGMLSNPPNAAAAKPYSSTVAMRLKSSVLADCETMIAAIVPSTAEIAQPSMSIRPKGTPMSWLDSRFEATAR